MKGKGDKTVPSSTPVLLTKVSEEMEILFFWPMR